MVRPLRARDSGGMGAGDISPFRMPPRRVCWPKVWGWIGLPLLGWALLAIIAMAGARLW